MSKYYALSKDNVKTLTNILEPDIVQSPVLENFEVFRKLGIKVIEDTEFERGQMIFRRKGGEARRYKQGESLKSKLGYMEESKLTVYQSWARYEENLQNFREKEPFSILGSNQSYNAPVSEFIIRQIGKQYAGDVLSNLFFGKESLGAEHPLGLYNGYWTLIDQAINMGKISKSQMNLVDCTPIQAGPETEDGENYDAFVEWVEGWHPALRNAERVLVYMTPQQKRLIIHSYMRKFTGLQSANAGSENFKFVGMENIELVTHAIIGKGDRMIATVPENLRFALDKENDWNSVKLSHSEKDFNVLIFQVQSTQGAHILDTSGSVFCVSNGTVTQIEELNGDYQKNTLTITSNDPKMGKVQVNPQKDEYEAGETITLTPQAELSHEFVAWSDGATLNPRSIVYSGYPTVLQAIFKKTE